MIDSIGASDGLGGGMSCDTQPGDESRVMGSFHFKCTDSEGNLLWEEEDHNLFTTLGKNALLNGAYNASITLTGPYMGLISSASVSAVSAADTMASHAGWLEANSSNAPNYAAGARGTAVYGTASAGTITAAGLSFVFSNTGTVQGAFICAGSGAVSTYTSTAGTLMNAGTLASAQPVISGNTLTITHSGTLT